MESIYFSRINVKHQRWREKMINWGDTDTNWETAHIWDTGKSNLSERGGKEKRQPLGSLVQCLSHCFILRKELHSQVNCGNILLRFQDWSHRIWRLWGSCMEEHFNSNANNTTRKVKMKEYSLKLKDVVTNQQDILSLNIKSMVV